MNTVSIVFGAILLTTLLSCGGYNDSSGSGYVPPQQETDEGQFVATLTPQNVGVSNATGSATVTLQGDQVEAVVQFNSGLVTTHAQHIHAGTRCPTAADDSNGDGVLDAKEAEAVYGAVLVPLDTDLADPNGGSFPTGANYNYAQSASLTELLANFGLREINVLGRVVDVHGVPVSVILPPTAQGGNSNFPVACGILQRAQ